MTTYYKQLNENGEPVLLLTYGFTPNIDNPLLVKITEDEYNTLLAEIEAANQLEEIYQDEISDEEALNIIVRGAST